MGIFGKLFNGNFADMIRCDQEDYLIWKWHPTSEHKEQARENAIRWGSSLRVKEGEVAVFVYAQDNGVLEDFIVGPYDGILETSNLPVISDIIGKFYSGGTPFPAEVYFINLAAIIQTKFAVTYFDVFDPRFDDYAVPVAVRGTISFSITDYREFIRLHRLSDFSMERFREQIKDAVARYVKAIVANAPAEYGIPVTQLERKIGEINALAEKDVQERLAKQFGITVSSLDVAAVDVNKNSEGYQQLMAVTRDLTAQTLKARNEVEIQDMRDRQKLGIRKDTVSAFADIKESTYARHKQTQMAHFAAYQTEAAEHVGVASAEGFGKMVADSPMGGFHPASVAASFAVGSAMGKNLADNIRTATAAPTLNNKASVPPPIPAVQYHVAIDGKATGPFEISTLKQMASAGTLTRESLVWKPGMEQWEKAGSMDDLQNAFIQPPPIPKIN